MNWPSARSSRAIWPFSTTKREPESLAAVGEIHVAEVFAELVMLLRRLVEGEGRLVARMGFQKHIVGFVAPDRHVVMRQVRDHGHGSFQIGDQLALFLFSRLDERLDLGDLVDQLLGTRIVARALGLADFLGGRVAAFLRFLKLRVIWERRESSSAISLAAEAS